MTVYFVQAGDAPVGALDLRAARMLRMSDAVVFDHGCKSTALELAPPSAMLIDASDKDPNQNAVDLAELGRQLRTVVRLTASAVGSAPAVESEPDILRRQCVSFEMIENEVVTVDLTASAEPSLEGTRVVVTRAKHQAPELVGKLRALGASVIELPVIEVVEASDGGTALRSAIAEMGRYDWLVVTSPNTVERLRQFSAKAFDGVRVAAIGPGTAAALEAMGLRVELVPEQYVAESLVEAFEEGSGQILIPRAAVARDVLPEGLRAKGYRVDVVEAYRAMEVVQPPETLEQVRGADVITFTASSTVRSFVDHAGLGALPPFVACIGPITADTAAELGVPVDVVAGEHTIEGLVNALAVQLASRAGTTEQTS